MATSRQEDVVCFGTVNSFVGWVDKMGTTISVDRLRSVWVVNLRIIGPEAFSSHGFCEPSVGLEAESDVFQHVGTFTEYLKDWLPFSSLRRTNK